MRTTDMTDSLSLLPPSPETQASVLAESVRHSVSGTAAAEEMDEHGDAIFHFRIDPVENAPNVALADLFRQSILEILKLVRFYSDGKPVIIDSIAYLNEPHRRIRLLTGEPEC